MGQDASSSRAVSTRPPLWLSVLPAALLGILVLTTSLIHFYTEFHHTSIGASRSHLTHTMFLIGLAADLLIAAVIVHIAVTRWRHYAEQQGHYAELESLTRISARISSEIGQGGEVLEELTKAASQLLRMDGGGIGVVHEQQQRLSILAYAGNIGADAPRRFDLSQAPATQRALQTGRILFMEDAERATGSHNLEISRIFNARSFIVIPLNVGGRAIGLAAFNCSRPRRFTPGERRLAELLGSQAAVILSNSQLYREMRSALLTGDLLRRELHHRVKNNLSGIVTLLSMQPPDLPAPARQWLERVINRIRALAVTHELFSGEITRIEMRQLIEQVLPTLSVICPSTVQVRTSLDEARIWLDATQAVGLATALHELCVNAIVHGLSDGGTLTLRARRQDGGLCIEVIDDGRGIEGDPFAGSGAGLKIVRELVSRELKGTFALRRREEGGTLAAIQLSGDDVFTGETK